MPVLKASLRDDDLTPERLALWTQPTAVARMTKLTDLRSHRSRLSVLTFLGGGHEDDNNVSCDYKQPTWCREW